MLHTIGHYGTRMEPLCLVHKIKAIGKPQTNIPQKTELRFRKQNIIHDMDMEVSG